MRCSRFLLWKDTLAERSGVLPLQGVWGAAHAARVTLYHSEARKKQFSVTARTPMRRTHLSLLTWAHAIFLLVSSSEGIPAMALTKMRGIPCTSAWYLGHRVRAMMTDASPILIGVVEIDDWTRAQRSKMGENHFTLART